jgi:hypothetical protein
MTKTKPAKKTGTRTGKTAAAKKKQSTEKRSATKKSGGKNKLGVRNSLVNNINARKKRGISRPKKKSTVAKKAYKKMQRKWK